MKILYLLNFFLTLEVCPILEFVEYSRNFFLLKLRAAAALFHPAAATTNIFYHTVRSPHARPRPDNYRPPPHAPQKPYRLRKKRRACARPRNTQAALPHHAHTKNLHFFWCVQSTYNFLWLFVVSYHLTKRAGPREHSLLTGRPRCSFLRHEVPSSVIGQTIIYFFARYHGNTTPGTKFSMTHNDTHTQHHTISHVK